MKLKNNLTGKNFNRLTVLDPLRKNNRIYYFCKCSCGVLTKPIRADSIQNGLAKSCGCLLVESASKYEDLTGRRFNRLVVIEKSITRDNQGFIQWICQCDCGNITKPIRGNALRHNEYKSCGCFQKDALRAWSMNKYGVSAPFLIPEMRQKAKETIFERYGVENVTQNSEFAMKSARGQLDSTIMIHWKTGEEIVCQAGWEPKVIEYWNKNKVDFRWQLIFKIPLEIMTTKNTKKQSTYRVDAYLPDYDLYVEIKGRFYDEESKLKWEWFHGAYPNSELWNEKKLRALGIHKIKLSGSSWVKQLSVTKTDPNYKSSMSGENHPLYKGKVKIVGVTTGNTDFIGREFECAAHAQHELKIKLHNHFAIKFGKRGKRLNPSPGGYIFERIIENKP